METGRIPPVAMTTGSPRSAGRVRLAIAAVNPGDRGEGSPQNGHPQGDDMTGNELPIITFDDLPAWEAWRRKHGASSKGLQLKFEGRRHPAPPSRRPRCSTCSVTYWKPMVDCQSPPGRLARPVVSMVFTEPPPPEPSMSRIMGSRNSLAICPPRIFFVGIVASAEPPRTVKSSPETMTRRPGDRPDFVKDERS